MSFMKPKVGVFIPCIAKHIRHLPAVIKKLDRGYVRPHRVAVVLSNLSGKTCKLPGGIALRSFDHLVETGPAKQMAYEMLSDCDVICYQDADDLPSLNRVAYIQQLFTNPNVGAFNHSYRTTKWPRRDAENDCSVAFPGDGAWELSFPNHRLQDATKHGAFGGVFSFPIMGGAISVRRSVLANIHWRPFSDLPLFPKHFDQTKGDDWHFCFECLYQMKQAHWFSRAVLYRYRVHH